MEIFTLVMIYSIITLITIPVMRWMFRAELQEVVEKTINPVFERTNQLTEMVADLVGEWQSIDEPIVVPVAKSAIPRPKKVEPVFHYNTETNELVCCIAWSQTVYNMSDKRDSDKAMEMIALWNEMHQKAEDAIEEAEDIIFEIEENMSKHISDIKRYRGHEWGVKSKLHK